MTCLRVWIDRADSLAAGDWLSVALDRLKAVAVDLRLDLQIVVVGDETPLPGGPGAIDCPLTLRILEDDRFPVDWVHRSTWVTCAAAESLRSRVTAELDWPNGEGQLWLPLIVTAKGPLYGEAIALDAESGSAESGSTGQFLQPHHLSDRDRQAAYRLGFELMNWLRLPPGLYLMQFGFDRPDKDPNPVYFDRLLPFPAAPAIASIGVQTPDLFECHLRCLLHQPLREVAIL